MPKRVISMQMTRDADDDRTGASSEYVSKRLCCSFIFTVGFISILGGFLLGRYATDRALLLKSAQIQHKQQDAEHNSIEIMNNITSSIIIINNITRTVHGDAPVDRRDFLDHLRCANHTVDVAKFDGKSEDFFSLIVSKVLNEHLESLNDCFFGARRYLEKKVADVKTVGD